MMSSLGACITFLWVLGNTPTVVLAVEGRIFRTFTSVELVLLTMAMSSKDTLREVCESAFVVLNHVVVGGHGIMNHGLTRPKSREKENS